MKIFRKSSAQATIEYLLFAAVVIGVLFVFLSRNGTYEKSLRKIYNSEGNRVIETGKKMFF